MIIKGITKDALINILLTEREFRVVDTVPFQSTLGRDIIEKYGLEYLYNNRYTGVSALDCVFSYYMLIRGDNEKIQMNEYEHIGIYEPKRNPISMEQVNINLERHSGTIQHFSTYRQLGYWIDTGTNLLFDVVVYNDKAGIRKTHCNKMWKNHDYSTFFLKWKTDKENFQENIYTGDTFLACICSYFMDISMKTTPENIRQRDKEVFKKAIEGLDKSNDKKIAANQIIEIINKRRSGEI